MAKFNSKEVVTKTTNYTLELTAQEAIALRSLFAILGYGYEREDHPVNKGLHNIHQSMNIGWDTPWCNAHETIELEKRKLRREG